MVARHRKPRTVKAMTTTPATAPLPKPGASRDRWTTPDVPGACPVREELFHIAQAVRALRDAGAPASAVEILGDWARDLMRQHTALPPHQRALAVEHLRAGASVLDALRQAALDTPVTR